MVQVLQGKPKQPSFLQSVMAGAAPNVQPAIQQYFETQQAQSKAALQMQQMAQENEKLQQMGIDLSGITDPKMRQAAFSEAVKGMEKQKLLEQKKKSFSDILNQPHKSQRMEGQIPEENKTLGGIDPSQFSPEMILEATNLDPALGRTMQALQDVERRENREEQKIRTDKEKEYFKLNEPKLMELGDSLTKLENESARYSRLEQLFSDPSKFPSAFTAALVTKDGQINDKAYALLSPEAQESIKLIVDSTSNIKDSYGARITNFDIQTYLKKLPSLLNTPEGKTRVLRDLQIMNQLNQMHAQGIMEIFQQEGGTDKIPYSKAEQIYRKTYGPQEKRLRELFVNPDKETFKEMPSAFQYLGRKIRNPKTGEIFISDGQEWKPYKE